MFLIAELLLLVRGAQGHDRIISELRSKAELDPFNLDRCTSRSRKSFDAVFRSRSYATMSEQLADERLGHTDRCVDTLIGAVACGPPVGRQGTEFAERQGLAQTARLVQYERLPSESVPKPSNILITADDVVQFELTTRSWSDCSWSGEHVDLILYGNLPVQLYGRSSV